MIKLTNMKRSIETDQEGDFNNRDDETSQYSKSMVKGRQSKVSVGNYSKANTNQIESNLNFIENQINGNNYQQSNHSKSPFS